MTLSFSFDLQDVSNTQKSVWAHWQTPRSSFIRLLGVWNVEIMTLVSASIKKTYQTSRKSVWANLLAGRSFFISFRCLEMWSNKVGRYFQSDGHFAIKARSLVSLVDSSEVITSHIEIESVLSNCQIETLV